MGKFYSVICLVLFLSAEIGGANGLPTFSKICSNTSLTSPYYFTVAALLKVAQTQDCKLAESRLTKLTALDLSNEKITDISPLTMLPQIESLWLTDNHVKNAELLSNLKRLRKLSLIRNGLWELPSLGKLTNLKVLYLDGNRFTNSYSSTLAGRFPGTFLSLESQADLVTVCEDQNLGFEDRVVVVSLMKGFSTPICSELASHLSDKKVVLNLTDKNLGSRPINLGFLGFFENAEELDLEGDDSEVPLENYLNLNAVGRMKSLNTMIMGGFSVGDLKTLEGPLSSLGAFTDIYLMGTHILSPLQGDTFASLKNLKAVALYKTGASGEVPESLFSGLKSLELISLCRNNFSGTLKPGLFQGLTKLTSIRMYGNDFEGALPQNLFSGLNQLGDIDLSEDHLSGELSADVFKEMPKLTSVMLRGNQFSSISEDFLSESLAMKFFDVSKNTSSLQVPQRLLNLKL